MAKPKIAVFGLGMCTSCFNTICSLVVVYNSSTQKGSVGQATAAHLALTGYDVTLGNRTASKLQPIMDNKNQIAITGVENATVTLSAVGSIGKVMNGRDVVVLCVPATGHTTLINMIIPYLQPHHHIVLQPGQLFGAFAVHQQLFKANISGVTISEWETSLFTCRATRVGQVEIMAIKAHLGMATMPSNRYEEVVACFEPYKDHFIKRKHVLATGLDDLNILVHPLVTILNAGPIERGQKFLYYRFLLRATATH